MNSNIFLSLTRIYTKVKLFINLLNHKMKIYNISKQVSVKINFLDILNYNKYLFYDNLILNSITDYISNGKFNFNILYFEQYKDTITESNKGMMILNLLVSSKYNKELFYIKYRNEKFYHKYFDNEEFFNDIDRIIRESQYFK